MNQVTLKLREMTDRLAATNEDIQSSLTQGNTMTERAYNDISRSYESLKNEVSALIYFLFEHIALNTGPLAGVDRHLV